MMENANQKNNKDQIQKIDKVENNNKPEKNKVKEDKKKPKIKETKKRNSSNNPLNKITGIFKYACLGAYYTLYGILFPAIYLFDKVINVSYASSQKKQEHKISIDDYVDFSKEEKKETPKLQANVEDIFREYYEKLPFVKAQRAKEEIEARKLILEIQENNLRSENPLVFKYTIRDADDKKYSNIFIAYSKLEVLLYLQSQGYKVINITTSKFLNVYYDPSRGVGVKFKNKDLIFWLTQLSTYLKAGIPLTEAMQILSKQMSKNKNKKRLFDSIIYYLTMGESFSSALSKQGKAFPALLISMVKTAEATGKLEETLDDMANYYTEIEETRKAIISAMTYPSLVSLFAVGVVTFIMLYIIPQFQDIYASSGAELNGFTLTIISISDYLQHNVFKLLLIILLVVGVIILFYKNVKGIRKGMQEFLMKLPFFGKVIIYKEINVFTKTFSSLLQNNVFITESMTLLSEITNNEIYKEIMYRTIYYIAKGDKISTAFKDHWAVPDVAYYMIVTGESTGELASMMEKVSNYYQTQHKAIINGMKAFIEPVMIIFLAVVVGAIVLAIVFPMFSMYSQIS